MPFSPQRIRRWATTSLVLWVLVLVASVANACAANASAVGTGLLRHASAGQQVTPPCHPAMGTVTPTAGVDDIKQALCVQGCYQEAAQAQVLKSNMDFWPLLHVAPPPANAWAPVPADDLQGARGNAVAPSPHGKVRLSIAYQRLTL